MFLKRRRRVIGTFGDESLKVYLVEQDTAVVPLKALLLLRLYMILSLDSSKPTPFPAALS